MATATTETQSRELSIEIAKLSSRRGLLEESRQILVGLSLVAADWLTLCACLLLVWSVRTVALPLFFPSLPDLYELGFYFRGLYFFAPWLVALAAARLYSRHSNFWDEVRAVVRASTWGTVMVVVLGFTENVDREVARTLIGSLWIVSLPALTLSRYWLKKGLARAGLWCRKVLVVGAGDAAIDLANGLKDDITLGYEPIAFVSDHDGPGTTASDGSLPVFGPYDALPSLLDTLSVRDVVIAIPDASGEMLSRIVSLCEGRVDSLRVMPASIGMAVIDIETETIGANLLISMRSNLARPSNLIIKRITDVFGAVVLLVPAAPMLLAIALMIRLDSRGPAFYVQERVGRHGRLFRCLKFRTMHLDAEQRLQEHLRDDAVAREEWLHFKKLKTRDPRVTRVGRYLRRLSLDELPQLGNVLRGDMSLVGPRPYIQHELDGLEDKFRTILLAWPGITGLWQVSGRNELTLIQRMRLDEYYVRNWSLWLDLQIFLRTFGALAKSDGAY
ncbi:MAG TPA: sugar transferase [Candidatus Binatia bacterium]|nr:sugar transferase [Candidatus Binatia bacterium]